jgi:hypothetical protein
LARSLVAVLLSLCAAHWAHAHNVDTSYVRVAIERDRIECRFTLDVFTLQKITELDADHDQRVTPVELQRAAPALERFLREHVRLELDGTSSPLGEAADPAWPRGAGEALAAPDWHSAESLIAITFRRPLARPAHDVAIAFDFFETFGIRHTVLGSFVVDGRSEEVTFTQPEPDYLFDTEYGTTPAAAATPAPSRPSLWAALVRFFKLGMEHIFLGPDHLCFLLALLVVGRLRDWVRIVTSFTVAHSITLILAGLQIARLPSRFVECAIAATIVYVAVENLWRREPSHRWRLTFAFGLVHGFGFANSLLGMGLPASGRVRCLLVFNVGVEVAQLVIVVAAVPLLTLLARSRHAGAVRTAISAAVGVVGLGWLVERAFGLSFMPW